MEDVLEVDRLEQRADAARGEHAPVVFTLAVAAAAAVAVTATTALRCSRSRGGVGDVHEPLEHGVLDARRRARAEAVDVRPLAERCELGFLLAQVLQGGGARE